MSGGRFQYKLGGLRLAVRVQRAAAPHPYLQGCHLVNTREARQPARYFLSAVTVIPAAM